MSEQRERDVRRFTEGDCHILARAIHVRTGWPICAFGSDDDPDLHAFVRMPDGRFLDVEGPRSEAAIMRKWEADAIHEFDWRFLRSLWGGPMLSDHSYRRSQVVADELLAALEPAAKPNQRAVSERNNPDVPVLPDSGQGE